MELSIQKIKKEIESKRRHNEEILKLLKEKSIIYNAEKEKQKKYFLNSSSSLLSKKRKHSNDNDESNRNDDISNDISNYEDYDDYIDDFNSSFFSNRTFTNLNFCRPERFSFSKNKKKLSIKNEQGFTLKKTIIPKPMTRHSNLSLTLSHTSSMKEDTKNKEGKISLGLFNSGSNKANLNSNQEKNSFFDIKVSTSSSQEKNENKGVNSLFGDNMSLKLNNESGNNINTKSLFSSNITDENKKEEKSKNLLEDKKDKTTSLFGDLNRLNKKEEGKPLFSATVVPSNSDKPKDNEKSKGLFSSPKKENKSDNLNDNKAETPKKITLLGNKEKENEKDNKIDKEKDKEKEKKEIEKEKISIPLLGFINKENDKDTNKEKDSNKNIGSLFSSSSNSIFGYGEKKEEKKEETKEKINYFNFKPNEKEEKKEENNKPKESGSLFGNIINKEEKPKSMFSLFNSGKESSLFGNQTPKNESEKKEEKKETINQGLFSSNGEINMNKTSISLFNTEMNKSNTESKSSFNFNDKPKEEIKFGSNNSKGSLATEANPFLQPKLNNNVPVIFNANQLPNNNMNNNTQNNNNNFPLFNNSNNNNNNIFMNNNNNKSLFGFLPSSSLNTGNMEMSPENKSKNLNPINNNNNSSINIFGAPINNTTNNSIFGKIGRAHV